MTSWALFNDNIGSVLSTGYLFLKMNCTVPFAHTISSLKQRNIYGWVEYNVERFTAGGATGRGFTVWCSGCLRGEGMSGFADTTSPLKNTVGFNLVWKKITVIILLSESKLFQI